MSAVLITIIMYLNKILNALMEYGYKGSSVDENKVKCLGRFSQDWVAQENQM